MNRHDLSVLKVYDPRERDIPDVGVVHVKDSETGDSAWIDTGSKKVRDAYYEWFRTVGENESKLFNKYRTDNIDIATSDDYVSRLMLFFNRK